MSYKYYMTCAYLLNSQVLYTHNIHRYHAYSMMLRNLHLIQISLISLILYMKYTFIRILIETLYMKIICKLHIFYT